LYLFNCCVRDNFGDVQVIHYRRDKVTMKLLAVALAALQLLPAISLARSGAIGEIFGRWFGALGRPGAMTEATFLFGALPE
jgi:hypothetical protein